MKKVMKFDEFLLEKGAIGKLRKAGAELDPKDVAQAEKKAAARNKPVKAEVKEEEPKA